MAKPKFDVNYVLARRDISTPSSGSGTSELFLMLLLTVSAFVGFLSEDAYYASATFVGGMLLWITLKGSKKEKALPSQAQQAPPADPQCEPSPSRHPQPTDLLPLPSPEATLALIKARRSVFPKDYNGQKLTKQQVDVLLEASNWAPTHNNTQSWRFVVLGGNSKAQFEQLTIELVEKYTEPKENASAAVERLRGKALKAWPLVSHYIAIILSPAPSKSGKMNPEWEDLASVACAVQNIGLQATSMGIAGYWTSWQEVARDAEEMREFLGLSSKDRCLGLFCLGFSSRSAGYRGSRAPIEEKVQWRS